MTTAFRTPAGRATVLALYRQLLDSWPVPHEERRLPTGQGETFVLSCGPPDAPPVVLLHGSQANLAAWLPDVPAWSRAFRLHLVDMIGEPGLSAPSRPPLEGDAHALWLGEVLDGLGVTRAAFVGNSLGGWLALDFARRRPEAVEKLALLAPAGIGRQKNLLLKAAPLLLLGAWGKRRIARMVFGPPRAEIPPAARPLIELMEAVGEAARPRVVRIPRLSDDELAALTMPILAVAGAKDALLASGETRDRLHRFAPHADVRYQPEGYHFLPDQTATIAAFLEAEVSPPGRA